MNLKVTALIVSGVALAGVAVAAQPGQGTGKGPDMGMMKGAMLETHFAEMDANKDGNVDHDEFIAFQAKKNEQRWAMFSSHAGDDGVVSLDEAKAHHDDMKEMHGARKGMGKGGANCPMVQDAAASEDDATEN